MNKISIENNKIIVLILLILIYLLLKLFIPYGNFIVYSINLLVTFMHEFGHGFFAILTGGSIESIQINTNGSGYTTTKGGVLPIILVGGYIGSAIFGNLLLYFGFKKNSTSKIIIYILIFLLLFTSIIFFNSIVSSLILILLGGMLYLSTKYTNIESYVLQFLGVSSIIFIIEDFNVGPSSDLDRFSTILPSSVWMIIWLLIVIIITAFNLKLIFKK